MSLSHTHGLESKRIWLLKERAYNNNFSKQRWTKCSVGYMHKTGRENAVTQTNARKMKYNTVTNKQHTPPPCFKSSILEQNIKHSCFVQLEEFSSWIIVLFKQNRALKIAGFRWEEQHEFSSTTKHMELTEIGGNESLRVICPKKAAIAQLKGIFCVWERGNNCRGKQSTTAE